MQVDINDGSFGTESQHGFHIFALYVYIAENFAVAIARESFSRVFIF